jgi:multidrug efflux pump subunit AcrB
MTLIAVLTIPLAVLVAIACLQSAGETINVMTLAGLALAIGPLVDVAIICLENTHRHISNGVPVMEAAYRGSSEVALPALVSTLCTFLVLMPLVFVPGMGEFLFWPMTLAVFFAMVTAYFLAQTLVPSYSGLFLKPHASHHHGEPAKKTLFSRWEGLISGAIAAYTRALDVTLRKRLLTLCVAVGTVVSVVAVIAPRLGREFFPDVDAGSFEFIVRAPTGTRIEQTEELVSQVEETVKKSIPEHDLQMIVSQLGVTPDISAAYTPNAGPMDAVIKVQLKGHREKTSQYYVRELRRILTSHPQLGTLEYSFDAGGMVRSALNEGKCLENSRSGGCLNHPTVELSAIDDQRRPL